MGIDPVEYRQHIRRIVEERGLTGLANDTKWRELREAMLEFEGPPHWRAEPRFRFKTIDEPWVGSWDSSWLTHHPYDFLAVEWLDVELLVRQHVGALVPPQVVRDDSAWVEPLLERIGFDRARGRGFVRLFGYAPRNMDLFEADDG